MWKMVGNCCCRAVIQPHAAEREEEPIDCERGAWMKVYRNPLQVERGPVKE
jgi:hypothetical protein